MVCNYYYYYYYYYYYSHYCYYYYDCHYHHCYFVVYITSTPSSRDFSVPVPYLTYFSDCMSLFMNKSNKNAVTTPQVMVPDIDNCICKRLLCIGSFLSGYWLNA